MTVRKRYFTSFGHFKTRLMERFGIAIDLEEFLAITRFVQEGRAQRVPSPKDTALRQLYAVCIKGQDCCVVYDRELNALVTVLRRQWVESSQNT